MGEKVILDTSALIEIFDRNKNTELLQNECQISVISLYEYIRYKKFRAEAKKLLEDAFDTFNLSNPIILIASEIFSKLRTNDVVVNENDVYIAATAMANNAALYTCDMDFYKIKKLFDGLNIKLIKQ
jgi:tRNA(fMet)-specific endonuclease VapC